MQGPEAFPHLRAFDAIARYTKADLLEIQETLLKQNYKSADIAHAIQMVPFLSMD